MKDKSVVVVGAGVAGLTAGALLAHEGYAVKVLEAHSQVGGCAGTFKRGSYVFDVGATQVAGLEHGGIHERIFRHLNLPLPSAELLDPACVVDLADGSDPICLWHDQKKWVEERSKQFPGSEKFWDLCMRLHQISWSFASKNPVIPPRNFHDLCTVFNAMSPETLLLTLCTSLSVENLLQISNCANDRRLKHFLDLQLRLFSQGTCDKTAALYGATVLQMGHSPLGLWHLHGSMQKLSQALEKALIRDGGQLFLRHRVIDLEPGRSWRVKVVGINGMQTEFHSSDVVFTLPPQCLGQLISSELGIPISYRKRLESLPKPTSALVFYGALKRPALPVNIPSHLQFDAETLGSLFVSISCDGDGRAPLGEATIVASLFANPNDWSTLSPLDYKKRKKEVLKAIRNCLDRHLNCSSDDWLHQELSTPRSFAKWTGRPQGIVGGLGQHPSVFGPFGLASRTPISGLWLCGDSIYPGEGTAGVSQSAVVACSQLLAKNGESLKLLNSDYINHL